jgi:GDP-L-fucose synthase
MTILVAGSTGLVGSTVIEEYRKRGISVVGINSSDVDLTNRTATFDYISTLKPSLIIDAAAKVGGIMANATYPVDFLSRNLQIQTNLIDAAHNANVERFIFLGSSCIYPKECAQPIKESYLLTGPLEKTNSPYALAKISGIELIKSYRNQYGKKWISVMPTNLYGPRDNFDPNSSHVLPGMINKFIAARNSDSKSVELWGDGTPTREFLLAADLAKALIFLSESYDSDDIINIGTGIETSIKHLANLIANETRYSGEIKWDTSKPNGTMRKVLDVSKIKDLGWRPENTLSQGIKETIEWYESNK